MQKLATVLTLLALTPVLGGCFSYTKEVKPEPTSTTVVRQSPSGATTTTTTTPNP